ncbi:MAG: PD40 domain-containing protein [Anaerolineales bacterium]|nr:PD40 domain-containing protein [Anaerolineales bacterium]
MRKVWFVTLVWCSILVLLVNWGSAWAQVDDERVQDVTTIEAVGDTVRVNLRSDGTQGNNDSANPYVSADGRFVAFASDADNLVSGDSNGATDIFVRDRQTNQTWRVSVSTDNAQGNFASFAPAISDNGRYVAFCSFATNLVANDTNNVVDVFLYDRDAGTTTLVSRSTFGVVGNDVSCKPDANLQDVRGPDISADGRYIVFESFASDLVGNDNNNASDIFRYDRDTGSMIRISVDSNGVEANGSSFQPSISAEGLRIAFASNASNLVTGDGNGYTDVFVHNLSTNNTRRVSVHSNGSEGNGQSYEPEISDDGLFVVFVSFANNLVSGDDNNFLDVFIRDRDADETYLVSVSDDGDQPNVFAESMEPSVSENGRFVVFQSYADNLAPGETNTDTRDVFVRDRQAGTTAYASVSSGGQIGNQSSREPVISADGYYIVFSSKADNLVANDTNDDRDIFSHQIQTDVEPPPPTPTVTLTVNFMAGAPGSVFAFSGSGYGQNQPVAIYVNNVNVGIATADFSGNIAFRLDSNSGTQQGMYIVRAENSNGRASAPISLDDAVPVRPTSGSGPTFSIPAGVAYTYQIYLPSIFR